MKEQFFNIFKTSTPAQKLKFNKRVSALLVCFLISLVFWFLIALSKDYSATLSFPIVYYNLPGQKVIVNDLPSTIKLNVKTSGFRILSYNFRKEKKPVEIDVDSKIGKSFDQSGDVLVIPTKTFSGDFSDQMGGDVSILNFIPDSIVFNFSYKSLKRVAVKPDMTIHFEKQYDSTGACIISPDTVLISGPGSVINKMDYILTEHFTLDKVKEPVSKKVKLLSNKLVTISDTIVKVMLPVEKFTEENVEVPIQATDVRQGYSLKTFPDKIMVRYQVALSKYSQVSASLFDAVADASEITASKSNKLPVKLISVPSFVRAVSIEPEKVDYILRKQ